MYIWLSRLELKVCDYAYRLMAETHVYGARTFFERMHGTCILYSTSAPPSLLRRLVTPRVYGGRFSRLRRSIRYGCWPLVSNGPTESAGFSGAR